MKALHPVLIAGIPFDALITEGRSFSADIPEYPVETGYSVSDNISLKPQQVDLTLYITDTPVTWKDRTASMDETIRRIENLYFSRSLVAVVTADKTYSNMGIVNLGIKKSTELGYMKEISISLKEVMTTSSKTAVMPDSYGRSGTTGTNAGSQAVQASSGAQSGGGGENGGNSKSASTLFGITNAVSSWMNTRGN